MTLYLRAITVLSVLVPGSVPAQVTGAPVLNNPHTVAGLTTLAGVSTSNREGAGGYGTIAAFTLAHGRVAVTGTVGTRNPDVEFSLPMELSQQVEGYGVYGTAVAVRLLGGGGRWWALNARAAVAFEDGHRVEGSRIVQRGASRKSYDVGIGVGARASRWGVTVAPWMAGGVRVVQFDFGRLPRCVAPGGCLTAAGTATSTTLTALEDPSVGVGGSAGVDLNMTRQIGVWIGVDVSSLHVPVLAVEQFNGGLVVLSVPVAGVQTTPVVWAVGLRWRWI